ncbi:zinc carboxypeptidase-like [Arctopsyche grandis]|uniref:zinc carboxypeptidase-like n=1 Tax=Arctopsyche grandis TaxID=121162 RepID=UPI00406D7BE5
MKLIFLFLLAAWSVCAEDVARFEGYKVFRMSPKTQEQKDLLLNLATSDDLDFWTEVNNAGIPVDVMVKPEDQKAFTNAMLKNGMNPEIFIEDVQSLIETQTVGKYAGNREMTWNSYYTLIEIYQWLDDVAAANPGVVSVVEGGVTSQARQIKGVKIAKSPGKRVVVIEGGIHAREWISPATVTWIINEILTSTNPAFRKVADSFEWHLFPSTNPDGYVYTFTNNRMWRKTRKQYGICAGADPNRNWDAHWMEQGTSSQPCSDTYGGPSAFSEVETSSFSSYIKTLGSRMDAYISFHSYSQLLLLPYGHTSAPLDNYSEMIQIGKAALTALAKRYGTSYEIGNIAEAIYPATGGTIDWIKQEFKTPIVIAYELRDTGRYGFLLPTDQIIPNNEEVIDSLIAMFEEGEKFGYVTLG